ncbi:threonine deaminase [Tilletia horrida]|nr:threonine deaminase [Tilletia horrida]
MESASSSTSTATAAAIAGAASRPNFPSGTGLVDNDVQPSRPPTPDSARLGSDSPNTPTSSSAAAAAAEQDRLATDSLAGLQLNSTDQATRESHHHQPTSLPSATSSTGKTPLTARPPIRKTNLPTHLYSSLPKHTMLPDGTPDYLQLILSAQLDPLVKLTPLESAHNLSARLGCQVLLKREDLQPVFSFKLRGAFNMMRQLNQEQKWKGVIACSAGNHAQGVAMAGAHLKIPCTIVMPVGTPEIKSANVARLGAKVVLHGLDFDAAKAECNRLAEAYGLTLIPPFDHPHVIAGQGTIASEISRQLDLSSVDAIFCCVGGGGLLAGVASFIKRIAPPHVKVIGVETYDGDALYRSLQAGKRVLLDDVGLFSDGTAVRIVGEECFRICANTVDDVVRVSNDEICAAIKDIFEETRSVPEPAGALATAGMKRYIDTYHLRGSNQKFVTLVSGANVNFSRLRFVAERADLGERREAMIAVGMEERRGQFLDLYQNHIYPRVVTEVSYRYSGSSSDENKEGRGKKAQLFISFLLSAPPGVDAGPVVSGLPADVDDGVGPPTLELAKKAAAAAAAVNDDVQSPELAASLRWASSIGNPASTSGSGLPNGGRLNWGTGGPKPAENVPAGTAGLGLSTSPGSDSTTTADPSNGDALKADNQSDENASVTSNSTSKPLALKTDSATLRNSKSTTSQSTAVAPNGAGSASTSSVHPKRAHMVRRGSGATADDLRPPAPELEDMLRKLEASGMPAIDISGNELAKAHARYIIGGKASVKHERIFRFEFPERPNALQKFLVTLHETKTKYPRNITLFHYRNYGSDVGKVLAGIAVNLDAGASNDVAGVSQMSEAERELEARSDLDRWLVEELGYPFVEETENVVYQRFLRDD